VVPLVLPFPLQVHACSPHPPPAMLAIACCAVLRRASLRCPTLPCCAAPRCAAQVLLFPAMKPQAGGGGPEESSGTKDMSVVSSPL
jgi:hypothetical protein